MKAVPLAAAPRPDVDARGFAYALEPVRQRQQWRLDRLLSELARAQHAVAAVESRRTAMQHTHDQQAYSASQKAGRSLDPQAYRQALTYLASLRGQCQALASQRDVQTKALDALRQQCVAQQLRLEGLSRHKEDALTIYAETMRRRASVEQDRDWLARVAARAPVAGAVR